MRKSILLIADDNFTEVLKKNISIENISPKLTRLDVLNVFDDTYFSYQSSIDDLRRSIFLQGFANKNPMQEIKVKSFLEYELFMKRFINEITLD
jgi:preprotein translocase subunit SecA